MFTAQAINIIEKIKMSVLPLSIANIVDEDRNIKIIIKEEIIFFEIEIILLTQKNWKKKYFF